MKNIDPYKSFFITSFIFIGILTIFYFNFPKFFDSGFYVFVVTLLVGVSVIHLHIKQQENNENNAIKIISQEIGQVENIIIQSKNLFKLAGSLFWWLVPLAIFLLVTFLPKIIWNLNFNDYMEFLRILIWPCTVLIILFFFKKIATYLFFSMDGFNFFGAKGNLKNVNDVIIEEVNRKFLEEKNEEMREKDMKEAREEIKSKEAEISKAQGSVDDNLNIAKGIMKEWKKSIELNKKSINNLAKENRRLKEIITDLSPGELLYGEQSSAQVVDDSKTSDPISEESNINK